MTCPASTLPIRQRLSARILPPDPAKYRDVQDAADWKNPYLVITRDGFNVRFQGGGSLGRYLCSLELWSDSPIRRGLTDAWLQNQKSEFGSSEMAR